MRRLVQTLSLAVASLLLFALPASAAGEETVPVTQETGFGSGMWDGLYLGLVFAVIIGIVVFVDAYAGRDDEAMPRQEDLHH